MSLKNKLIIGASATSIIPLATLSCSNERTPAENKAIVDAVASLVQVSVYDKESTNDNARVKTNIDNVYSTYVKSDRDVIFHGFNNQKYQVVETSYENFNGYTVVKFKLKDIKTSTLSEQRIYTIRGFKLNPEYSVPLTSSQESSVDLFKSEMKLEANTDVAARVKEFSDLSEYVEKAPQYTNSQFTEDLKNLQEYLEFLQKRFEAENYSDSFEVKSLGDYHDHQVDMFDSLYSKYKDSLNRLLTLKAVAFLNDNTKNGLSDKDLNTYVQAFKDKVKEIRENTYWVRNKELRDKYNSELESILDQIDTLQSKEQDKKEKLQKILEQFGQSDLTPEEQVKYAILKVLSPEDGANKLVQTIQGDIDKLREADQKVPATNEQKDGADRYKNLIRVAQTQILNFLIPWEPLKFEKDDELIKEVYGTSTQPNGAPTNFESFRETLKDKFYKNLFQISKTVDENKWYTEEQFNKDVETLSDFLIFLLEQKVTDKDNPATAHWKFEINNLYDVKKYNLDKFLELESGYKAAATNLNSMLVNLTIKADTASSSNNGGQQTNKTFDLEALKTKQTEVLKKFEEKKFTEKPEFRGLLPFVIRAFGKESNKIEQFAKGLWEHEFVSMGLNEQGLVDKWEKILNDLFKPGQVSEQIEKEQIQLFKDYNLDPEHVKKVREYVIAKYIDQLEKVIDYVDKKINAFSTTDMTDEQKNTAKLMQKWLRVAQVYIPAWRGITADTNNGSQIDYKEANQKEKEFWESFDKSKDPLYKDNVTLFNSDLQYYLKFMEFLQAENVNKQTEVDNFIKGAKEAKEDASSLTKQKHYYEANVDLFASRWPQFKEVFGRLRGLVAYNWLEEKNHSELVTPEALQKLYNETKDRAKELFFVDMTDENATKSNAKPTSNPAKDVYDAHFDFVKNTFKEFNALGGDTSDDKNKVIDEENTTFADTDAQLRDRYLQYRKLTALQSRLASVEEAYANTPVSEEEHNHIEQLKNYLKGFRPTNKEQFLTSIKNKVYAMLTRPDTFPGGPEGDKAKYSVEAFLGKEYDPENGSAYQGDLRDVANFLDYLDASEAAKLQPSLPKVPKPKEKVEYSLKQYSDNKLATYLELEKKFKDAMNKINSYVVESFLEKETTDTRFKDTSTTIKSLIEKYTTEYTNLLSSNSNHLTNDTFKEEKAVLDASKALLDKIKEDNFNFTNLMRDYFIASLPNDNGVDSKNYIRIEELSKFILFLKAFEAHLDDFKSSSLVDAQKSDLNAKEKELNDNSYVVDNLDVLSAQLFAVNKEFLHPDHDADTTNNIGKHSYSEADLTKDIRLIINFYQEAKKLDTLIKQANSKNSSRIYRKTLEHYNGVYSLAKIAFEGARKRVYENKLDLYKLKAKELKELTAVNNFDTNIQGNNQGSRVFYTTATATQKTLLILFGLKEDNSADSTVTEKQKEDKAKEVLGSDAKTGDTAGPKRINLATAISKELKLFILNISQAKGSVSTPSSETPATSSTNTASTTN
ncbi:hypothetical protein NPA08_00955 [Mycoplasmopsis citelli]|uniref:hypothetical protein n=1 Tax=Mycoplasmopsis citelli TaxID=171281 RepID=UPI00211505D1|nr:hypothetical protein [Mycoplasmopsis citelli]UUD36392.1 hypothetical protein NPA08_00955 [Mycoplasmopsis citelli]